MIQLKVLYKHRLNLSSFSSLTKREKMLQKQRNIQSKFLKQEDLKEGEEITFQEIIRNFYKKAHPDLIRSSNPDFAQLNDESMQHLNGLLTTIKTNNQYPPQIIREIPFQLRLSDGTFKKVVLNIKTAGGDCRRQLKQQFSSFFKEAGLHHNFSWGKDYFPIENF